MDDVGTKRDDKLSQIQIASRPKKATVPDTTAGSKIANLFVLWLVVFSCAVAPAALFALSYSRSLHLQGTANDADFWFLIQATLVQVQGLFVSALLERKRDPSQDGAGPSGSNCSSLFYCGDSPLSDCTKRVELLSLFSCWNNSMFYDIADVSILRRL